MAVRGRPVLFLALLWVAPGAPGAGGEVPPWLSQNVRLELGGDHGREANVRTERPGAEALRRWARRLRGMEGRGPGFWYERRAVYLGVRRRF